MKIVFVLVLSVLLLADSGYLEPRPRTADEVRARWTKLYDGLTVCVMDSLIDGYLSQGEALDISLRCSSYEDLMRHSKRFRLDLDSLLDLPQAARIINRAYFECRSNKEPTPDKISLADLTPFIRSALAERAKITLQEIRDFYNKNKQYNLSWEEERDLAGELEYITFKYVYVHWRLNALWKFDIPKNDDTEKIYKIESIAGIYYRSGSGDEYNQFPGDTFWEKVGNLLSTK